MTRCTYGDFFPHQHFGLQNTETVNKSHLLILWEHLSQAILYQPKEGLESKSGLECDSKIHKREDLKKIIILQHWG